MYLDPNDSVLDWLRKSGFGEIQVAEVEYKCWNSEGESKNLQNVVGTVRVCIHICNWHRG